LIAKVNVQGVFTYANRMMCEIAGVEIIEGRNINDLFAGNGLAIVR
jgi:PAS domain-containing protein